MKAAAYFTGAFSRDGTRLPPFEKVIGDGRKPGKGRGPQFDSPEQIVGALKAMFGVSGG